MAAVATIMLGRAQSRREQQAGTFDTLPTQEEAPSTALDPELEYVNLRSVLTAVESMASFKGWLLYCGYFVFFMGANYRHFDIAAGRETLTWFADAVSSDFDLVAADDNGWCLDSSTFGFDCYTNFLDRSSVEELHQFLQHDLSRYIVGIKNYCPDCEIALSVSDTDVTRLTLPQYICTDFELAEQSASLPRAFRYAARDCVAVDAAFRASPSAENTPCCRESASLPLASLFTKIAALVEPAVPGIRSIDEFLAKPGAEVEALLSAYTSAILDGTVGDYVRSSSTANPGLVQIVIRRGPHFAGVLYEAQWVDTRWLPGRVSTGVRYWSRRYEGYDESGPSHALVALAVLFFVLSTLHELLDLCAHNLSWRALAAELLTPYGLLVWAPSIVLPWVAMGVEASVRLTSMPLLLSLVELLMFVRWWAEGEALAPFRIIVLTLKKAAGQLATFCVAMLSTIVFFAAINSQLSGAFDGANAPFGGAVSAAFDVIVQGSPLGGANFDIQPDASLTLYYAMNLFLFLILAQFFIAILVGAFDATREAELARLADASEVPRGFEPIATNVSSWRRAARARACYHLGYVAFGANAVRLQRKLYAELWRCEAALRAEARAQGLDWQETPLMLSQASLARCVGKEVSCRIVAEYGVRALPGMDDECAAFLPPAERAHARRAPSKARSSGARSSGAAPPTHLVHPAARAAQAAQAGGPSASASPTRHARAAGPLDVDDLDPGLEEEGEGEGAATLRTDECERA